MFRSVSNVSRSVFCLATLVSLAACGDNHTSSVPPGLPAAPQSKNIIAPTNAQSATETGATAIVGGNVAPLAAALDLKALNSTAWASSCYRFGDKGDYSKKFWAFAEGSMESLLVKYKDDACTQVSAPSKAYGVWKISSIAVSPLREDWSVVKASCTSGNCAANVDVAFRVKGTELHEGSKDSKTGDYFTAEGRYVAYTKAAVVLDKIAADANTAAPVVVTPPVAPISTVDATGLALLDTLAGKAFQVCVPGKADATTGAVTTSNRRILKFAKGADLASDSYTSENLSFSTTDCSGEGKASTPWIYQNLQVKAADVAGWILLDGRACTGTGCKPQKALIQITPEGLKQAGEDGKNPGKFYTETPRIFTLVP